MPSYFNDSPIEYAQDDRYGVLPFAKALAKSLLSIQTPVGSTIALSGPWGSGKSSAVNLIRNELKIFDDKNLIVTDFKCWWYRGEEALALAFLQNLNSVLKESLGKKVKNLIPDITRQLLQAGPVIGQAVSLLSAQPWLGLIPGISKFARTFFPKNDTLEKNFKKLSEILGKETRRFLVIIDDIDRLTPDEAIAIFRLVKSVGRLPNVMYLLVFDRELAEKAVLQKYPSEGPHFLEKIIQATFELPQPLQVDLNSAVLLSIQKICGEPEEAQVKRVLNLFHDAVVPYITTPRHVARFANAISVTWPAIAGEINLGDFIALETLRLYEPAVFRAIRLRKEYLCGVRSQGESESRNDTRFSVYLHDVPEIRKETVKVALQRLFPRLETMGYGSEFVKTWDMERRICVQRHFDTYFRLALSDESLPANKVDELIRRADDATFIKTALQQAASTDRKNGRSMVPVYLNEMTVHGPRVEARKVESFFAALFEVHDEIDLEKDAEKGFGGLANTSLRFHWLIRAVTRDRFSIAQRTAIYMLSIQNASLGWLVDFVSSARNDYDDTEGRQTREEDRLVEREALDALTDLALRKIRSAAADGSLFLHKDLVFILYRWREFNGNDPSEVRAWTDSLISNDVAVVRLARLMTGQSWSYGMGGFGSLGDRISMPTVRAQISDDTDILDVREFRERLKRVYSEKTAEPETRQIIRTFLDAWDRQKRGRDN